MKYIITESQYKLITKIVAEANFENQSNVDTVLDKINKYGIESLNDFEKKVLGNPNKMIDLPDGDGEETYVQKAIKVLTDLNFIDLDKVNIYENHFELYEIKGKHFNYFEKSDGFLIINVDYDDISRTINLIVSSEDVDEDELDDKWRKEVYDYVIENWEVPLSENDILIWVDDNNNDEFYQN